MSKIRLQLVLSLLLLLLYSSIAGCETQTGRSETLLGFYPVKKVVDGDTFWIDDGSDDGVKIRLIGVDAPESRKTGKKEIGYYGAEAKAFAMQRLTGKKVRLEFDVDRYDRWQRTLAYVYLEDGTFFNAEMVRLGFAVLMTVPPNVQHADLFVEMQHEARDSGRGLWGVGGFESP